MKGYFGILCLFLVLPNHLFVNGLTYTIDSKNAKPSFVVGDHFLSVTVDTHFLSIINLTHPHLIKLVRHLSPMHLRLGGTAADNLSFENDNISLRKDENLVLNASRWSAWNEFAKNTNVRILFDLNALLRNSNGSWNSENAEEMIKYSRKNGYDLDWELGNEPDFFPSIHGVTVSAHQLGKDYETLRSLLDQYHYNSSRLVGPSMFDVGSSTTNKKYLADFLSVASKSIYAVTWHQYHFSASRATENDFLNASTFNYLEQRIKVVTDIVGTANKVWLGETSTAYNQGAPNKSDRFLATFLWLDKLGLCAKFGVELVIRQTIWGYDRYALLDHNFNPNPDYWVSALYKKLVGTKVLSLENDGEDTRTVRLYAHCAKSAKNAVVVFGLNFGSSKASFSLAGLTANSKVLSYELTPENADLYSKTVLLNGAPLSLSKDLNLPNFNPTVVEFKKTYSMPAHSLGFWVFSNTNVKACQ